MSDVSTTKARYLEYVGKVFRDEAGNLREGDIFKNGVIMRFHNGYLDGQGEPAIETSDCHLEYWDKGQLVEVVTDYMNTREKWENGKRVG